MKTHFTQADVGKTFATSQQGVTATMNHYREITMNEDDPKFAWNYSNGAVAFTDQFGVIPYGGGNYKHLHVQPSQPIPSEADLLRKEIAELKASHEADLRTAVEMARESIDLESDFIDYKYTIGDIIKKIDKYLNHGNT